MGATSSVDKSHDWALHRSHPDGNPDGLAPVYGSRILLPAPGERRERYPEDDADESTDTSADRTHQAGLMLQIPLPGVQLSVAGHHDVELSEGSAEDASS